MRFFVNFLYFFREIRAAGFPPAEFDARMAKDSTTCCRRRSDVVAKKPSTLPTKKRSASPIKGPPPKKPQERVFRASTLLGGGTSAPSLATKTQPPRAASSASLVCAPDILNMFSDDGPEISPAITPPTPRITISAQPSPSSVPPLAIRQYVRTPGNPRTQIRPTYAQPQTNVPMVQITQGSRPVSYQRQPQGTSGGPVYHTINGFRIDLNTASQQETFRLPNGKLIQVKKQAPNQQQTVNMVNQRTMQRNLVPVAGSGTQFMVRYPQQQQQARILNGATPQLQVQPGFAAAGAPQMQQIPQIRPTAAAGLPLKPPPCLLQKPSHPPTPLGIARNAFEFKVYNSLEVCHQIIGKINTLSNYPSYKTVNHVSELKDLYTHLSYLLTYAISRFQSVKDKCAEESKALGLDEEKEKSKDKADDELEVIENQAPVIDLDSDDENENQVPNLQLTNVRSIQPLKEPEPLIEISSSSSSNTASVSDAASSQDSIRRIIEELNDPKLKQIPRVEILKAETLIPSVKQLLKRERRDSVVEEIPPPQDENVQEDSDYDPIASLLEVTPDISCMMTDDGSEQPEEEESDKESVIDLIDSPVTVIEPEKTSDKEPVEAQNSNEITSTSSAVEDKNTDVDLVSIDLDKTEEEIPESSQMSNKSVEEIPEYDPLLSQGNEKESESDGKNEESSEKNDKEDEEESKEKGEKESQEKEKEENQEENREEEIQEKSKELEIIEEIVNNTVSSEQESAEKGKKIIIFRQLTDRKVLELVDS